MSTIQEFQQSIPKLSASDQSFASSLCKQWTEHPLSCKQMYWVDVLIKRASSIDQPVESVQVAGVERIRKMFDTAAKALKFPKIWLGTDQNQIRLSIAGPKSRHCGSIMVTDGRPYGSNRYYGAIARDGSMIPGRDLTTEVKRELIELASNPEGKAAEFGRLTGHCCFCNAVLTDERSVSVGYGPVCAKHFGLQWGGGQRAPERLAA